MSSSNSVIRRYTPPTCTLEIWAENSPLSQLMDKAVLKDLNFRLQFDDPRLPEESKISIRGDKEKLEILCNIVTSYVQELLQQSAEDFGITLSNYDSASIESEHQIKDIPASNFTTSHASSFNTQIPQTKIYLEPGENLTHKLFLGSLANQTSGQSVDLTLLQLFDLATALDEYSSDVITLPNLSRQTSQRSLPKWAPIAAILVVGVGLAPLSWQYANNLQTNQQVAKTTSSESEIPLTTSPPLDSTIPQSQQNPLFPNGINPSVVLPSNAPIPPTAILPQTGLNTSPNLQNLPPNTSNNLPPNSYGSLPVNPQYPLTTNIPNTLPPSTLNIPLGGQNSIQSSISAKTRKSLPSNKNNSSTFSTLPRSVASIPNPNFSNSTFSKTSNPVPTFSPAALPQGDIAAMKNNPLPESSSVVEEGNSQKTLVAKLKEANKTSSSSAIADTNNNQTLFDTPQIVEVREYLQKRWQAPSGLSQTLEYSLTLGVDGKIERILPLNQPAREYINNTGIPEIGKPFVSTNKSGQTVRVRVVLGADGKVQTFPENP